MKLLGLDFDNTLVQYDKLFHQLALEKGLIHPSVPVNKTAIRDHLRSQDLDEQFTLLQGEVYGLRILEAEPAEGILDVLAYLHQQSVPMVLVSHKTRTPYKGPKYDLRKAALNWLKKYNFFEKSFLDWGFSNVYFEDTKPSKISRISALKCTHYLDDLPEIIENLDPSIHGIWYNPLGRKNVKSLNSISRADQLPSHIL